MVTLARSQGSQHFGFGRVYQLVADVYAMIDSLADDQSKDSLQLVYVFVSGAERGTRVSFRKRS